MYLDANNLYGWAMSQKLPLNGFEWVEELSEFDERFMKNYNENHEKGYVLEVEVEYPTNLFNLQSEKIKKVHKVIQFNQEERLNTYIDMNTKLRTEGKK